MPLFKHLWVAKERCCTCVPNFRVIPEKELFSITSKFGIHEKCCEIQVIRSCEEQNGCIVSSTGKVNLSLGFNDTI